MQSAIAYGVGRIAIKSGDYMRIPKDITLVTYIRELIQRNEIYKFYKTDDWLELKEKVLEELHGECQGCLKKGRYTMAECVHHVNHVKVVPRLALSKFYIDKEGKQQRNLVPLCNACHWDEHPEKHAKRCGKENAFVNEERW